MKEKQRTIFFTIAGVRVVLTCDPSDPRPDSQVSSGGASIDLKTGEIKREDLHPPKFGCSYGRNQETGMRSGFPDDN